MLSCFSCVQLFVTLWTIAHQAPLFMGFSRQEHWSGLPFPSSGDFPNPRIKPMSLTSPALASGFFTTSTTWEAFYTNIWGSSFYSCLDNPHRQRSLMGYSPWGLKESDTTEWLSTAQHTAFILNKQTNKQNRSVNSGSKLPHRDMHSPADLLHFFQITSWTLWAFEFVFLCPLLLSITTCPQQMTKVESWVCSRVQAFLHNFWLVFILDFISGLWCCCPPVDGTFMATISGFDSQFLWSYWAQ